MLLNTVAYFKPQGCKLQWWSSCCERKCDVSAAGPGTSRRRLAWAGGSDTMLELSSDAPAAPASQGRAATPRGISAAGTGEGLPPASPSLKLRAEAQPAADGRPLQPAPAAPRGGSRDRPAPRSRRGRGGPALGGIPARPSRRQNGC